MDGKIIEYLNTKTDNFYIKLSIYYDIGGACFSAYHNRPRGVYISAQPVRRQDCGGGVISEGFTAFTGYSQFITECARKPRNILKYINIDDIISLFYNMLEWIAQEGNAGGADIDGGLHDGLMKFKSRLEAMQAGRV